MSGSGGLVRWLGLGLLGIVVLLGGLLWFFVATYVPAPVDPAWAYEGGGAIPEGAVTVRFTGTSTLLFSDGETDFMIDGWFSRFGALQLFFGEIAPDIDAIERGLAHNGVDRLAVVIPVHSHFDHAMDAPEVARRTGALLLGSESTANIARGWGLDEARIRVAVDREPVDFGDFRIRLIETEHFQFPDPAIRERALGEPEIDAPLYPPVPAFAYRVGKAYAVHVEHPLGRFLVQGSAGFRPGGLDGYAADVVFLGVGGLGSQTPAYREQYWRETVERVGAKRVIPIHWDSLTGPIEGPFTGPVRAAEFLANGSEATLAFLRDELEAARALDPAFSLRTLPRYAPVVILPRAD